MTFAMILLEDEVIVALESLLANVGFHGIASLSPTDLDSKPFSIGCLTEEMAHAFIKLYGSKRRDAVFRAPEKDDDVELLLSEETAISAFSAVTHMRTLPITHAEFCSSGLLLTLESDEVKVGTETIFGGFVPDRKGKKEDLLFQTPCSALLARNRAKEAAELATSHVKGGIDYDTDNIIVRKRIVQTVSASSSWVETDSEKA